MSSFQGEITRLVISGVLTCGNCNADFDSFDEFKKIDVDGESVDYHCTKCERGGSISFSEMNERCALKRIPPVRFSECVVGSDDEHSRYIVFKGGCPINGNFVQCGQCGHLVRDRDARHANYTAYCASCFDVLYYKCVSCGHFLSRVNVAYHARDGIVCEACYSNYYMDCPGCGRISRSHDFHAAHDDLGNPIRVCARCWNDLYHLLELQRSMFIQFRHDDDLDAIVNDPTSEA